MKCHPQNSIPAVAEPQPRQTKAYTTKACRPDATLFSRHCDSPGFQFMQVKERWA
jgi:hypothetical protein